MSVRSLRAVLSREDGFTLLELLVALTVLAIGVTVAWSALMTTTVKAGARAQELGDLQTELRGTVDRLSSELRQAQCNATTTPGTSPVTTATGTQLTFTSPDRGMPYYHLQQISYQLTGGELDRQFKTSTNTSQTGPPWTMPATFSAWAKQVGSVTNAAAFSYKDANGAATTVASKVVTVLVSLTVKPRTGLGGAATSYQTTVDLRTPTC